MLDTSHAFGRPISAVLTVPDGPAPGPDKWTLLSDLTRAARAYGLGHRTLSVLKALMTFLPGRAISARPGPSIVFPANRTLSERLNGMPESTLRRHLAALVAAGIVSRRDSPNRKRFARRIGGEGGIAFGFDLSPLARRAPEIAEKAEEALRAEEEQAVLRARLAELRAHLLTGTHDETLAETARKALRRKDNTGELRALIAEMETRVAEEPSASDSQNERHIQDTEKKDPDLKEGNASAPRPLPTLHQVIAACPGHAEFFPDTPKNWPGLLQVAEKIAPMIGIERSVLREAQSAMGVESAAVTVLCLVERIAGISNPGGYLRRLTQLARTGGYRVESTVKALLKEAPGPKLSADNRANPCLATG